MPEGAKRGAVLEEIRTHIYHLIGLLCAFRHKQDDSHIRMEGPPAQKNAETLLSLDTVSMSNINQQTNFIRTSSHACARCLTNRSSHHNMTLPSRHFGVMVHDKVLWYNAPWPGKVFLQSERKLCYSEGCSRNLLPLI